MNKTPKAATSKPAQCRFCGRKWDPPRGVSVSTSYCAACSRERREAARTRFSDWKELVVVGKYLVRRKKP